MIELFNKGLKESCFLDCCIFQIVSALWFLNNNNKLKLSLVNVYNASMNINISRFLCYDIYKTLTNLNPKFLNEIFSAETNRFISEQ